MHEIVVVLYSLSGSALRFPSALRDGILGGASSSISSALDSGAGVPFAVPFGPSVLEACMSEAACKLAVEL